LKQKKKRLPLIGYYPFVVAAMVLLVSVLAITLSGTSIAEAYRTADTAQPGAQSREPAAPPEQTPPAELIDEEPATDETSYILPYAYAGKWGYKTTDGEIVLQPVFDDARAFQRGRAFVGVLVNGTMKYGLIDRVGEYILEPKWEAVGDDYTEGPVPVKYEGLWGYMGEDGELMVDCVYTEAYAYSDSLARVKKDGLYGYIDERGELAIECRYTSAADFSEERAFVATSGEMLNTIIDQTGRTRYVLMGDGSSYGEGLAAVRVDNKVYYIDQNFRIAFELQPCAFGGVFEEGIAVAESEGLYGYIDDSGAFSIEARFEEAQPFEEGLAAVRADGKWGFIDQTGEWAVQARFDDAQGFEDGFALVREGDVIGVVDAYGNFKMLYNAKA
jgi:hypothetical protein